MRKVLVIGAVVALLAGCGESDPVFDGKYVCDVDQDANKSAILKGGKNTFPKDLNKTDIVISNRVITVKGMTAGDYVTPKLDEKKGKEGEELFYDKDGIQVAYTKKLGILVFSHSDKLGQILMNCNNK